MLTLIHFIFIFYLPALLRPLGGPGGGLLPGPGRLLAAGAAPRPLHGLSRHCAGVLPESQGPCGGEGRAAPAKSFSLLRHRAWPHG